MKILFLLSVTALFISGCSKPTLYCADSEEGICTRSRKICEKGLTGTLNQTCHKTRSAYCFPLHGHPVYLCARTLKQCQVLHRGKNRSMPPCNLMEARYVKGL